MEGRRNKKTKKDRKEEGIQGERRKEKRRKQKKKGLLLAINWSGLAKVFDHPILFLCAPGYPWLHTKHEKTLGAFGTQNCVGSHCAYVGSHLPVPSTHTHNCSQRCSRYLTESSLSIN